jgi:hypothetical protein
MNSSRRTALVASTLTLMATSLPGKSHSESVAQTVSIRLYNQAQAPVRLLHSSTDAASWLFRAARIRISWEWPSTEAVEDEGTDITGAPFRRRGDRRYVVLRLMPRAPATVSPTALGLAIPFAHSGAHILIFYDRVEALTRYANIATYLILGCAMAHEIAHVLLGSSGHSIGGIMEARWTPLSWRRASAGLLAFQPEEIRRIQVGSRRFQFPEPIPDRALVPTSSAPTQ